ncbi:MAG: MBL fold metallo-hydrolase [Planctomycetes bacterium]|nr:MBL fold metallo-hydrolase [Planctomycetota bacterium]
MVRDEPRTAPPHELVLKSWNDSGCHTHLLGCSVTRQALLIDPKAGKQAVYEKALADYRLTLAGVVDTHTHADHLSDSAAWIARGVRCFMGQATGCQRAVARLRDGDSIEVGRLRFRVLEVPGHTQDSIALAGHGVVVTGDTLMVGGLARADFRGSDPAQLFDGVRKKLLSLPDATVVLPGHGYQDILFTTIGHERAHNPALQHTSGRAYADALKAVAGAGNSPDVDATLALNLVADPALPDAPVAVAACCSVGGASIAGHTVREQSCQELAPRLAEIAARGDWIDVRDPWELSSDGRLPGVANFPLSELGFALETLRAHPPEVVSCKSGARSAIAVKTLVYLGVLRDPISMAGGFGKWKASGLPIA